MFLVPYAPFVPETQKKSIKGTPSKINIFSNFDSDLNLWLYEVFVSIKINFLFDENNLKMNTFRFNTRHQDDAVRRIK